MKAIRFGISLASDDVAAIVVSGRMMFKNGRAIDAAAPRKTARRESCGRRVARTGARREFRIEALPDFGFNIMNYLFAKAVEREISLTFV